MVAPTPATPNALTRFVRDLDRPAPVPATPSALTRVVRGLDTPKKKSSPLAPEAKALLEVIASTESAGAYNIIYGGDRFDDYSDHPNQYVKITSGPNKGKYSSAAGKYQFLGSTWDAAQKALGLPDFSPESQDKAAWWLAEQRYQRDTGRNLLTDLRQGGEANMQRVAQSLRKEWTSLPGGIEQGQNLSRFSKRFNAALEGEVGHPVPPVGLAENADAVGEGASFDMLSRFRNPGSPAEISRDLGLRTGHVAPTPMAQTASLQSRRNASDIGEGTTASKLARFGQPGAAPVSMSDELGRETGRIRTIPTPRPRPTPPPPSTPITDAANIQPLTFKSPLDSARAKLSAARQNGVTGSPIANVAAPNVDMARLSAETGRDIGRDGVTFDRTYDAGNRMSTPGFGSLLDSRSFSPATPNPQRASPPTGPSNRGRPVSSAAPAPTGPANRGRPMLSSAPSTPSGPANRGRPTSSAATASRPIGPIGITGTPGFAPAASPTNRTSPAQKTANGISGTAQMPLNARPSSPAVPKEPAYIVKKIQVLNPEWKEPVATDPLALERMEKAQTLNRYKPAPTVPKYITKTVTVPNPSYVAPQPQPMPPALAASRMTVGQQPNALRAPVPATQSAALRSQRAATPPSSAREYEAANRAAKQRAIANSSNPSKTAARASLAAQWGFD